MKAVIRMWKTSRRWGRKWRSEFPPEYSLMQSHGESSAEEGSEMEMEDDEGMGQEADDEKFAEDSKREGSCEPPEECEPKREDSQSSPEKRIPFDFEDCRRQLLCDTDSELVD